MKSSMNGDLPKLVGFRMPAALHKQLQEYVTKNRWSWPRQTMQQVLTDAVKAYLEGKREPVVTPTAKKKGLK